MSRPLGRALGASAAIHGGFALLALAVLATRIERVATATPPPRTNLVYIARASTTPMGGGGGHRAETPPIATTIPAPRPMTIDPVATAVTVMIDPPPTLSAPVQTDLASLLATTGSNSLALPGPGGGQGTAGAGPGKGPGLGPGEHGETGGGPRRIGGDISAPTLIRHVRPDYTNDALVARIQGTVELEAVVLANGTLGRITVTRSLHPSLDQQAIVAARKWLFQPGRHNGVAVDVIVTLILEFKLH